MGVDSELMVTLVSEDKAGCGWGGLRGCGRDRSH